MSQLVHSNGRRRVVVTGLGLVTSLGHDVESTWRGIVAGDSGVRAIDTFDTEGFACKFASSVRDLDLSPYMSAKDARKMDPFVHYGYAAAVQAIDASGLEIDDSIAERVGVTVGSGIGGLPGIEKGHSAFLQGGARKVSPFFVPSNIINMVSGNLSIRYGIKGPNFAIVSACTTGTHCIGEAARKIERGDVDVMIAGGTEMATSPTGVAGFASARALSTRNDDPQAASRPWDRGRDGFVLGDGAGVLVLEGYEFARQRGAPILAELVGYGTTSDAFHMTLPSTDGEGARRCMTLALADAGIAGDAVDYVNAHATSTPAGDVIESNAIKQALGAGAARVMVSSTKSMIGHLLGAAGGVEAAFSVLAIRDQVVPPTINLDDLDDGCDLDYVPNEARQAKIDVVVSNSFGFGGTNGALVFRSLQ